jgi:hypothetical protein
MPSRRAAWWQNPAKRANFFLKMTTVEKIEESAKNEPSRPRL